MTEPTSAAEPPAPLTPEQEAAKAAANRSANFKIVAVALVLLLCCIGAVIKGQDNNGDAPDVDRSNAAIAKCEDSVKSQLKAPSTAKFSDERYTDSDPSWLVTGSVDAENSFGAMLRNSFRCELTRSGEAFIVTSSSVG